MKLITIHNSFTATVAEDLIFSLRPDTALLRNNDPLYFPSFCKELVGNICLIVKIDRIGKHISERFAHRYYTEVGLGINFTAADTLQRAIDEGLPHDKATSFDHSAATSPRFLSLESVGGNTNSLECELKHNGEVVASFSTQQMTISLDRALSELSKYVTLRIGDLIYIGAEHKIESLSIGDTLSATLCGDELLNFDIR